MNPRAERPADAGLLDHIHRGCAEEELGKKLQPGRQVAERRGAYHLFKNNDGVAGIKSRLVEAGGCKDRLLCVAAGNRTVCAEHKYPAAVGRNRLANKEDI